MTSYWQNWDLNPLPPTHTHWNGRMETELQVGGHDSYQWITGKVGRY
jgi:hypothetical protein